MRNEWDVLSLQRATASDADSKVQQKMQQMQSH
jgi:hypothetical protein